MRVVHKYTIRNSLEPQLVTVPSRAALLTAAMQGDQICVWFQVEPESPPITHTWLVVGTGHPIVDEARHVGTVFDGAFVWHIFDICGAGSHGH